MSAVSVFRHVSAIAALIASSAVATSAQCLEVVDHKDAPSTAKPEVNVRQMIRLTDAGRAALGTFAFGYVEIVREAGVEKGDSREALPRQTFVRLIYKEPGDTPFTFSRAMPHTIRLFGAIKYEWPIPPEFDEATGSTQPNRPILLCGDQPVVADVAQEVRRPDFAGIRPQWWVGFRLPLRPELGTALFVRRFGISAAVEQNLLRSLGDSNDPSNINATTATFELRYRGSRGYLAGGVRYYPDDEAGRDHFRGGAFAGEELPSWKGRRIWLLVDLTLQERERWIKGLRLSVGARLDLWGARP